MTDNLDSGKFKIISLSRGAPIGVNRTPLPRQIVSVGDPIQDWTLNRVSVQKYELSINEYPYTGVLDGKVIASINPEHKKQWILTHYQGQNAFTIALAGGTGYVGWTVPTSLDDNEVEIKEIPVGTSDPPYVSPDQLFLIQKDD